MTTPNLQGQHNSPIQLKVQTMQKPQISIRFLMLVVVMVGLAFAALVNPSGLWASVTFMVTLGLLLYSLVMATFRRGKPRLYWASMAIFGWGWLMYIGMTGDLQLPDSTASHAIAELWGQLHPRGPFVPPVEPQPVLAFLQIGHCLFTIVVALLGALVVRVFATNPDDPKATERP